MYKALGLMPSSEEKQVMLSGGQETNAPTKGLEGSLFVPSAFFYPAM
jgi:hypothetical protein